MTWTPRKTQTREEFLAQPDPQWWKPRVRMPWQATFAIFVGLALLIIIALLLLLASY